MALPDAMSNANSGSAAGGDWGARAVKRIADTTVSPADRARFPCFHPATSGRVVDRQISTCNRDLLKRSDAAHIAMVGLARAVHPPLTFRPQSGRDGMDPCAKDTPCDRTR
jgi:hypothetical protein